MGIRSVKVPEFFIDSLPGSSDQGTRELLRVIEINTSAANIFLWLNQLRVSPYSYDFIDNRNKKSPDFIIENLSALKINTHFLLSFHVIGFAENSFISARFCEPVNKPVSLYMKELLIEYRIVERADNCELWCKLKGRFNSDLSSRGFYAIFSFVNKVMTVRQLKNIRKYSVLTGEGKITFGRCDIQKYYSKSGIHWWIFCRRQECKGLH